MLQNHTSKSKYIVLFIVLLTGSINSQAQKEVRSEPKWWFGISGAANMNYYRGTTQMLPTE